VGNDTAFWGRPSTSPFSPDFGASPPVLVGRRHEMAELGSGLATGPRDARYTSVLMGVRGSGKTALLNEMQDQAAAEGWVVLAVDASTPGLLDRIVSAVDRADQTYETLGVGPGDEKSVQRSVALRLGVLAGKLTTTRHPRERHAQDLRERLTLVAMAAERHGTSLLLTVDELHAVDRTEGRRLASDLQHITKREQLPLACVGAGLSEMKNTLMLDRKMTFFHRCETYDLKPLSTEDVVDGLVGTIAGAGGHITADALVMAAEAAAGSPYKMQVVGDRAWNLAGAPEEAIGVEAVQQAAAVADRIVEERVSIPAWRDLSDSERTHLAAVASLGGAAAPRDVSGVTKEPASAVSASLARMANAGYLARPRNGVYQLTGIVPISLVLRESLHNPTSAPPDAPRARCRKWMPRAQARCVLTAGHAGRCRSC